MQAESSKGFISPRLQLSAGHANKVTHSFHVSKTRVLVWFLRRAASSDNRDAVLVVQRGLI
jgi:hypothetical protein